jgi:hypothetical protein
MKKMKKNYTITKSYLLLTLFALCTMQLTAQTATAYKVTNSPNFNIGAADDFDMTFGVNEGTIFRSTEAGFPQDNSLKWKAFWDANRLYLVIAVEDNEVMPHTGNNFDAGNQTERVVFAIGTDTSNRGGFSTAASNYGRILGVPASGTDPKEIYGFASAQKISIVSDVLGSGNPGYIIAFQTAWSNIGNPAKVLGTEFLFSMGIVDYDEVNNGVGRAENLLGWDTTDNTYSTMENAGTLTLGGETLSTTDTQLNALGFKMYPNPTSTFLNVRIKSDIEKATVFNVLGSKLKEWTFDSEKEINLDVSNFKNGLYLIRLETADGVFSKRFIKK